MPAFFIQSIHQTQKLNSFFPFSVSFDKFPKFCETESLLVRIKIQLQNRDNKSLEIYDQFNDKESQEPSATLGEVGVGKRWKCSSGHLCPVTLHRMM